MLKYFGPAEAAATSKFCEMVDSFFDCLNVRSTSIRGNESHFLPPTNLLMMKDFTVDGFLGIFKEVEGEH